MFDKIMKKSEGKLKERSLSMYPANRTRKSCLFPYKENIKPGYYIYPSLRNTIQG